jgi:hypothetical protein
MQDIEAETTNGNDKEEAGHLSLNNGPVAPFQKGERLPLG